MLHTTIEKSARPLSESQNDVFKSFKKFSKPATLRSVFVHERKLHSITAKKIAEQKNEFFLNERNEKLEELYDQRNGSLRYARLLQDALLHDPETLQDIFPESFIYHSPKDILGGDFYWFEKIGNKAFVACADCTGHGVPGAMLSVLGINKLHETINLLGLTSPAKILDRLNSVIYRALGKKRGIKKMNDGMDISMYSVNLDTNILEYAGANNPLYIVRNGNLIELNADRQGIGTSDDPNSYSDSIFQLNKGDMLYTFSDGYTDQFGGDKGKKFMARQFKDLLISIADKDITHQKECLDKTFKMWMGDYEQVDDVCIIGTRIV